MNKSNLYRKLHVSATVNTRFSAVFTYVCMHVHTHTHTQAGTASTVVSFPPHSTNILLVTLSCGDKTARITSDSCSQLLQSTLINERSSADSGKEGNDVSACSANKNLSCVWHQESSFEWGGRPTPGSGGLSPAGLVFIFVAKSPRPLEKQSN